MSRFVRVAALPTALAALCACATFSRGYSPISTMSARLVTAAVHVVVRSGISPNVPSGYGPSDLQAAYNLPSSGEGAGQIVAVVDAYDNPNVASDLATYRSTFGLPPADFTKFNQKGQTKNYPPGNTAWGVDSDLAVEMISAACPNCTIYLIEADSGAVTDLEQAESEAVALGARVLSNGFTGDDFDQAFFEAKGVTYLGAAGSSGSVGEPAAFDSVVAVGGTTLSRGGGGTRGWTEKAFGVSGGCTTFPKPPWQHDKTCNYRLANDVAAVADPSPGVAEYDTYGAGGWFVVGGTSVPTPLLAGVFGLAGNAAKQNGGRTFWENAHHRYLYRVKSGGKYVRYSTAAGWGTPDGTGAF